MEVSKNISRRDKYKVTEYHSLTRQTLQLPTDLSMSLLDPSVTVEVDPRSALRHNGRIGH